MVRVVYSQSQKANKQRVTVWYTQHQRRQCVHSCTWQHHYTDCH